VDKKLRLQRVASVAAALGTALRSEARGRWERVATAERNEGGRHVWRFRAGAGVPDRFLHVTHEAMARTADPTSELLRQLQVGQWIERLGNGPETALLLSRDGRLESYPAS
jgi:hypothetical protein